MRGMPSGVRSHRIALITFVVGVFFTTSAWADRDVWAYILVGDGDHRTPVERLAPEETEEYVSWLVDVLNIVPPGGLFTSREFWNRVGEFQRTKFLNSAESMRSALISKWQVPSGQIETHHAWGATLAEFISTLGSFASRDDGDGEDLLIFYYVGHGYPDGIAPNFIDNPNFSYRFINNLLSAAKCEKLVIVDACYSGAAVREFGDSAWVLASTGENLQFDVGIQETVFTRDLVQSMERGRSLSETCAALDDSHSDMQYSVPTGKEGTDPIVPVTCESGIRLTAGTTFRITGGVEGQITFSAQGVASGTGVGSVTLAIGEYEINGQVSYNYMVVGYPSKNWGRGALSCSFKVTLRGLGEIIFDLAMEAEGPVTFGEWPNARSNYAPGRIDGTIRIAGLLVPFTGTGTILGETSGSSSQAVTVRLEYGMEITLQQDAVAP